MILKVKVQLSVYANFLFGYYRIPNDVQFAPLTYKNWKSPPSSLSCAWSWPSKFASEGCVYSLKFCTVRQPVKVGTCSVSNLLYLRTTCIIRPNLLAEESAVQMIVIFLSYESSGGWWWACWRLGNIPWQCSPCPCEQEIQCHARVYPLFPLKKTLCHILCCCFTKVLPSHFKQSKDVPSVFVHSVC